MQARCRVCKATTDVQDGVALYKCPNCGTTLRVRPDGSTHRPFEAMKIILPALVLLLFVTCQFVGSR